MIVSILVMVRGLIIVLIWFSVLCMVNLWFWLVILVVCDSRVFLVGLCIVFLICLVMINVYVIYRVFVMLSSGIVIIVRV